MSTLIFRTVAPLITVVMIMFSLFNLLRGHNAPGGGFIGGLIAASAIAIYGMAMGVTAARYALRAQPIAYAGLGVVLAGGSGFLSMMYRVPYLTGLWSYFHIGETEVALSTPMVFDIGVYLVVFGTLSSVALALETDGDEG